MGGFWARKYTKVFLVLPQLSTIASVLDTKGQVMANINTTTTVQNIGIDQSLPSPCFGTF